jgi:hypothetical protein
MRYRLQIVSRQNPVRRQSLMPTRSGPHKQFDFSPLEHFEKNPSSWLLQSGGKSNALKCGSCSGSYVEFSTVTIPTHELQCPDERNQASRYPSDPSYGVISLCLPPMSPCLVMLRLGFDLVISSINFSPFATILQLPTSILLYLHLEITLNLASIQ